MKNMCLWVPRKAPAEPEDSCEHSLNTTDLINEHAFKLMSYGVDYSGSGTTRIVQKFVLLIKH
jgi:hypothetical protein